MEENKTYEAEVVVQDKSPGAMIALAVNGGADLEKIEKLMLLQERWEANEAKKAYVVAMAAFKANPPRIEKTKHVKFTTQKGTTEYDHALLADAAEIINAALSKHGLHAGWRTSQGEGKITVTCTVSHSMGYSESTSLAAGADESGGKNSIQAIGSTVSYLERYTLFAITGLASHDMDDDGKKSEAKHITQEQSDELHALIAENINEAYVATFCKFCKVESLGDILAANFGKAKADIKAVIAKVKK